jgi:hypothetical protein
VNCDSQRLLHIPCIHRVSLQGELIYVCERNWPN